MMREYVNEHYPTRLHQTHHHPHIIIIVLHDGAATYTNKPRSHNILQSPSSTSMSFFLQHSQSSTMENLIWNPLLPVDFNSWSRFFAKFRISFIVVRPPYILGLARIFMCWYRQHYRKRHRRSSEECPSHKRAPVRRRDPSTLPPKPRYSRLPSHRQSAFTQKISAYLSRIISTSPLDHFSGL